MWPPVPPQAVWWGPDDPQWPLTSRARALEYDLSSSVPYCDREKGKPGRGHARGIWLQLSSDQWNIPNLMRMMRRMIKGELLTALYVKEFMCNLEITPFLFFEAWWRADSLFHSASQSLCETEVFLLMMKNSTGRGSTTVFFNFLSWPSVTY